MPDAESVAAATAVFCAAVVNGMSGFGFMLVLVPVLSLLIGPVNGVILANLISPFQGIVMFYILRKDVAWRTLTTLLLAGALGMPLGMIGLLVLPTEAIRVVIALSVLGGAAAIWRGMRLRRRGATVAGLVGLASGALKTGAGISGPPVVLYLQGAEMEPLTFRATLSAFFLVSNLMALVTVTASGQLTGDRVVSMLAAIPFLIGGALLGNRLFASISSVIFRRLVLSLLVAGSLAVLASAVRV